MIKSVLISKLTDGLVLCESTEGYMDEQLLQVRHDVKRHHVESTAFSKAEETPLKHIQNINYGIFYKVSSHVVFTIIADRSYPPKLAASFIDSLVTPFFDQAKCVLGAANYKSRLEAITSDHFFVKFDRTVKQRKRDFDDPSSIRNVDRMKKELENIHEIMKENMGRLEGRRQSLEETEEKARLISEESKRFEQTTNKLVWTYWIRNNLVWLVVAVALILIYFLIF